MNTRLKLVYCVFIFVVFTDCKSNSKLHTSGNRKRQDYDFYESYSQKIGYQLLGSEDEKFIETVISWLGVPYKYGGCSKEGTDCSCFVNNFYKDVFGINLPRKSEDMQKLSKTIDKDVLQQGDLVFFKISAEKVSHVGIYISKGHFVHASTSKGVMINSLEENYYKKHYHKAVRVER